MRTFDYKKRYESLLQPDIVALVAQIHEYKGEQTLFVEAKADTLTRLLEVAKIQSTEASNKIEGIYTSDERLKKIVRDKTMPKTRNEKEIAGYRDVLNTIHQNYDYIPVKSSIFLQLHRDLYKFAGNAGGSFKSSDNVIAQEDGQGNKSIRFQPVPAWETPAYIDAICDAFQDACKDPQCDPLILIPMFILDFLCIHPFNDGNGRMSRLLTLLLLYRAGYIVGMYISIEKLIEQSKETYYETLQESSLHWHEEENDDAPFVRYMLGVIVAAYRDFSSRVQLLVTSGMSKPERVREIVRGSIGKMTRAQIMEKCPDISRVTVERALTDMVKKGEILKIGGGRYTAYVWNRENE
ncbi:Fic family protein [Mediterraneibacter glycyrrhizinilyticus]|uniref:Fic family protein n=1 Tax=Mediterraneibacter glycyrrhizinilyticus TaxID=342942 RepID=UPI00195F9C47|nr:Fic family protein [Mediterraneibacter glycyrrhizinilyticus]MBM6752202.1 Fic family protein [Mediterraneibacter glycyrrhizinilyticus]